MKQHLSIIVILLSTHFSFGQGKFGIKVYQNTDIFSITTIDYDVNPSLTSTFSRTNFNRISIVLQMAAKNKLIHEIELIIPEFSKPISNPQFPFNYAFRKRNDLDNLMTTISLRYEIHKKIHSVGNIHINLGIGLNPYYINVEDISKTPNTYDRYTKYFGGSLNLIPSIIYKISNQFSLEINCPFKIYDLMNVTNRIANPAIPINQQTSTKIENGFLYNIYTFRFGVSYYFIRLSSKS
ncbi:MAG: hypothetical protein ACKVOQ_21695 [Cyclobacteriaceae bacterium]